VKVEIFHLEGLVLDALGRYEESQAAQRASMRHAAGLHMVDEMGRASQQLMFLVGYEGGDWGPGQAYRTITEATTHDSPEAEADWRNGLAGVLIRHGRYDEAEREARAAIELARGAADGNNPLLVANARNTLGVSLYIQGNFAEAEPEYRAALTAREAEFGSDHPLVATSRSNLAGLLFALGK
jgi:tetratricopeptide (TPR) repeat protein